jgi:hypothetical protein
LWAATLAVCAAVLAFFALQFRDAKSDPRTASGSATPLEKKAADEQAASGRNAASGGATSATPPHDRSTPLRRQIEALFEKLMAGTGTPGDVAALRSALAKADPREASEAALEFLRSGRDVRTGESFVVGDGGRLAQAPTLRVMLLDLLGDLSRRLRSDDAAEYSRIVLDSKTSPDEWSIALRNVGWHDPGAKAYLSGKTRELLTYPPWRANPGAGMLEAFDVAVFVHDPTLIPTLEETLKSEQIALQRASAIALDRLAERAPLEVMSYLNANPRVMAERPFVRADYFAKADLAQPAQRQALEFYLGRGDVSHEEKAKLLNALTTPASFVAEGLLTSPAPEPDDVARQNAVASATREWLVQNRFPQLRAEIAEIQRRLRQE